MKHEALAEELRQLLGFDTARVVEADPHGDVKLFLIVGTKKRSEGEWTKNGKPWSFDYVATKVVASGRSEDELRASAAEYKRLCGMTMVEYLREQGIEVPKSVEDCAELTKLNQFHHRALRD